MATYSCILAWRIPWTEEPGGLQSMGPQKVGHNCATESTHVHAHTHTHTHARVFKTLPEKVHRLGAWWAIVHGVWTLLSTHT